MPFTIRQYFIPMMGNAEREQTLCQITEECNALEAEGWQMHTQIALPGGREVLFTFSRPQETEEAKVSEFARMLLSDTAEEPRYEVPRNRGGRPRKVIVNDPSDGE